MHTVFCLIEVASVLAAEDFVCYFHFFYTKFFSNVFTINSVSIVECWQAV
ncbi:Uncharacterised protein [Mycobacterium tuberculosis]|nr:Uncharacterised protein [Mycobacterium tuberculosis]